MDTQYEDYLNIRTHINEINTICISVEFNVIDNYVCKLTPSLFKKVIFELNNIQNICKHIMNVILYYEPIDNTPLDIMTYIKQLICLIENFAFKIENGYYNCSCCVFKTAQFEYFEDMIYILEKCIKHI